MKVIGKTSDRGDEYICTVSHLELEKLSDKYYRSNPLKGLKVGDEMSLGAGYDFRRDINDACEKMTSAMKAFEQARNTLTKFALMVGQIPEGE